MLGLMEVLIELGSDGRKGVFGVVTSLLVLLGVCNKLDVAKEYILGPIGGGA